MSNNTEDRIQQTRERSERRARAFCKFYFEKALFSDCIKTVAVGFHVKLQSSEKVSIN